MKMNYHKLFNDKSYLYESARPIYPSKLYDYLSSLCPKNELAWDCACGNGQAAIGLVDKFERVYASDISEEQIKNSKQHLRIDYKVAASEVCALPTESCDIVCVAQALHWFEYEKFWPEVLRVLKPNGVFSTWGYNWPILEKNLDIIFNELILDVVEPYWAPQNKLIWNHYNDIDFPFKKIKTPTFSMEVNWNLNEFFNFIHTFSAVRRCMDEVGTDFFNHAYESAKEVWGNTEARKPIAFDFVFYVGRKKT